MRVRLGPPPAVAPVPYNAVFPVLDPREEDMSVEDILLPEEVTLQVEDLSEQRTLLSELFEKKTLQSEMLEPRQIFGEKFLQSAEEDVYESRSRILCEHGVDLE